jgi:uncharacterized UPF0160 family protein
MFNFLKRNNVLTHDGKFHADDVFATATLNILYDGNIKITRSRNPEIIQKFLNNADAIVDNGRDYNPEKNIFDHHQEGGAGSRENGVPYAAFGLVWKHFGKRVCLKKIKTFNKENINLEDVVEYVWQNVDKNLVSHIDATDTGYTDYYSEKTNDSAYVPDKIVSAFVPTWQENYNDSDKIFGKLSNLAVNLIEREIKINFDKFLSKSLVEETYQNSSDKRIIVFQRGYPWKEALTEKPEPLYAIFPTINGDGWMIQAVPIKKDSQEIRQKFPENWRGKAGNDLVVASGVSDAKFCHIVGFLAVTNSLEGAKKLAEKAIES